MECEVSALRIHEGEMPFPSFWASVKATTQPRDNDSASGEYGNYERALRLATFSDDGHDRGLLIREGAPRSRHPQANYHQKTSPECSTRQALPSP